MERSIQKLLRLALLIAAGAICSLVSGQEAAGPTAGPPVVSDQLPPRRSFPALPINDLRNASSRQTDSVPFSAAPVPVAPVTSSPAPSIPDFDTDSGNTSGSFLRPVSPKRESNLAPATSPPSQTLSAELPSATPGNAPLTGPIGKSNPPSALNPSGSNLNASRPIEIIADSTIIDSAVRPASGSASPGAALNGLPRETNPMRGLSPTALARQQLDRYRISRASEPLPGQPLKLEDLLRSLPPDRRRNIVRQYWNTFGAWASFLDCCDQCAKLDSIGPNTDPNQMKLLETSKMQAADNRLQAEIRLQQAQSELQRLLPSAGSDLLPLPADQPLVEVYETHADWYIANGQLPPNLRTVSRALPLQQKLVCQRAATADTATVNSELVTQAHTAMQCDLATLLRGLELSAACRQGFLQSVLDYNQAIADYSLGLAPANQPPEMIANMLVAPTLTDKSNSQSVLAEVPARPGDRWAGTPTQPRSIRTMPGATPELTPRQTPARVDSNPSSSFAPPAVNGSPSSTETPGFAPPPAIGLAPAMSNPAAAPIEPAPTANNSAAPFAPSGGPASGFGLPALPPSPPAAGNPTGNQTGSPAGNPTGSFSPLPTGNPAVGPIPPSATEKGPVAPTQPAGSGTQFKLGG